MSGPGFTRFIESSKRNTSRISPKVWERHKDVIIDLYDKFTLVEVVKTMKEEHKFDATKRQYVHQLGPNKWDVYKYKNNKKRLERSSPKTPPANNVKGKEKESSPQNQGSGHVRTVDGGNSVPRYAQGKQKLMHGIRVPLMQGDQPTASLVPPLDKSQQTMTNFHLMPAALVGSQQSHQQGHWSPVAFDHMSLHHYLLAADFFRTISGHHTALAFQLYRGLHDFYLKTGLGIAGNDRALMPSLAASAIFCAQTESEAKDAQAMFQASLAPHLESFSSSSSSSSSFSPAAPAYAGQNYALRILFARTWDCGDADWHNASRQVEDLVLEILPGENEDVLVALPRFRMRVPGLGGAVLDVAAYRLLQFAFERYNLVLPEADGDGHEGAPVAVPVDVRNVLNQFVEQQGVDGGIGCLSECVAWCRDVLVENPARQAMDWLEDVRHHLSLDGRGGFPLAEDNFILFCALWRKAFSPGQRGELPGWVKATSRETGVSASDLLVTVAVMIAEYEFDDDESRTATDGETIEEDDHDEDLDEEMDDYDGDDDDDDDGYGDEMDEEEDNNMGDFPFQRPDAPTPFSYPSPHAHSGSSPHPQSSFQDLDYQQRAAGLESLDEISLITMFLSISFSIYQQTMVLPSHDRTSPAATAFPGLRSFVADTLGLEVHTLP